MSEFTQRVTLYLTDPEHYVKKRGREFEIHRGDDVEARVPSGKVSHIVAFGPVGFTSGIVDLCREERINVQFLSPTGRFHGELVFDPAANLFVRRAQYEWHTDERRSLALARRFVTGKVANAEWMLQSFRAGHSLGPREFEDAPDHAELVGREGAAARDYFALWPDLLKNGDFTWRGRYRNPPEDPINALLSLLYVVLLNDVHALLNRVGFDPYFGFLHRDYYGRPSLACDVVEEWRPLVDKFVITLVNRREARLDMFERVPNSPEWRLTRVAFKEIITKWSAMFRRAERRCPQFRVVLSRLGSLERQVRHLARVVTREEPEYRPYRFDGEE
ncbi:MAG: CRISPR-associated endonuclease Cas1 [Planctomycetes bacterium]|nr:CRISPR-associated endonuclease Cas1 [Planctomycetota bacterium]